VTGYTPKTWVNDSAPALSAANLQIMDDGIEDAHDEIQVIENDINYPSTVKQKAIVDTGEDGGIEGGVFNCDFEYGSGSQSTTDWIGDESYGWYFTRSSTVCVASFDNSTIKIAATDATGKGIISTTYDGLNKRYIPFIPNTEYRLSARVKTDNVPTDCTLINIRQYDSSDVVGTVVESSKLSGDNDWTYLEVVFTSDADAAWGMITLRHVVAGNISTSWFDNIKLEQIDTQTVNTQMDELASVQIEGVTTTDNVDQSQLSVSGGYILLGESSGNQYDYAQKFVPTKNNFTSITVKKVGTAGTPTGNLVFSIVEDNGGLPTGSILSTKSYARIDWDSQSSGDVIVDLPCKLTAGSTYWMKFENDTDEASGVRYTLDKLDTGGSGDLYISTNGGTYSTLAGQDAYFKTHFAKHTESTVIEANGSVLDLTGVKLLTGAKVTVNADGGGKYLHDSGDLRTLSNAIAFANDIYSATDGDGDSWSAGVPEGIGINNWVFDNNFGILNNNTVTAEWIVKYEFGHVAKDIIVKFIGDNDTSNRYARIEYSKDMSSWNTLFDAYNTPIDPSFSISEYGYDKMYIRASNGDGTDYFVSLQLSVEANLDCQTELPVFAPSSEVSSETQDLVLNPIDISEDGFWQLKYDLTGWGSRTITMVADEATWEAQAVSATTIYIFDSNGTTPWTWDDRNGLVPPADRTSGAVMAKFLVGDNQIKSSVNNGSMKANVNLSWNEKSIRAQLNWLTEVANLMYPIVVEVEDVPEIDLQSAPSGASAATGYTNDIDSVRQSVAATPAIVYTGLLPRENRFSEWMDIEVICDDGDGVLQGKLYTVDGTLIETYADLEANPVLTLSNPDYKYSRERMVLQISASSETTSIAWSVTKVTWRYQYNG